MLIIIRILGLIALAVPVAMVVVWRREKRLARALAPKVTSYLAGQGKPLTAREIRVALASTRGMNAVRFRGLLVEMERQHLLISVFVNDETLYWPYATMPWPEVFKIT